MKKLFVLLILIIITVINAFSNEIDFIDLTKMKWEYRWGDSNFDKGIPVWTLENTHSENWKEISFPSNPPNRMNRENIWYRVKLPASLTINPTLYISSIDLISEVYYKSNKIYHYGDFNNKGKGDFKGWPWHMIHLPIDSGGKYLYFRVYSNYIDIGLWGEISISSEGQLFKKLIDNGIPKIMIGSVSMFVGVILILSFLSRWKRLELFILGLLFLGQGLDLFISAKILELYLFFPLTKQYILALVFFFFPVGMALFLDKTIKINIPFNIIRRLWQIHLIYLICSLSGALLGFYNLSSTYQYFDMLYNFISLPCLTLFLIYFFFKGNKEMKLITFSFFIISMYWLYSYLISSGILLWREYPSEIAIFSCLLLLTYSIINKLNYVDDLQVQKDELQIVSSLDHLTKLINRKEIDSVLENNNEFFKRYHDVFSVILLDIDNFKDVNDKHGHLVGDKVILFIAETLKRFTRKIDIVGRWGGEEFIIICPKTNKEDAFKVAEKIRVKIEKNQMGIKEFKSASFGLSSSKKNDSIYKLLNRTDDAMYISKNEGKNKITIL